MQALNFAKQVATPVVAKTVRDEIDVLPEVILHQGCLEAFFRPAIRYID